MLYSIVHNLNQPDVEDVEDIVEDFRRALVSSLAVGHALLFSCFLSLKKRLPYSLFQR